MIKRSDKDPETHKIANIKSTTNIETVLKERKTMTDKIAIKTEKTETEMIIMTMTEIEIVGGIMIVIETTKEETDRIEIVIDKGIIEEMEEIITEESRIKQLNKKILTLRNVVKSKE